MNKITVTLGLSFFLIGATLSERVLAQPDPYDPNGGYAASTDPYSNNQTPYPNSQVPYPNSQYPTNQAPYPNNQPQYPNQYPNSQYPGNQAYPANPNGGYAQTPYASNGSPSFYNDLSPYGQWAQSQQYGQVWVPRVAPGFQPYATNGHWVVTEFGNTWVSDYAWGWAPFHYGRWYLDAYYGWAWVPGYEWGPAWVNWRSGGGYYGWAPLGPGMNIGVNININIPTNWWVFVPQIYITSPYLSNYWVPRTNVFNIYRGTTVINNIYRSNNRVYAFGPRREDIEYVTRRSVPVYRIDNMNGPGRAVVGNGSVGIYRPDASGTWRGGGRPGGQATNSGGQGNGFPNQPGNSSNGGGFGQNNSGSVWTRPGSNGPEARNYGGGNSQSAPQRDNFPQQQRQAPVNQAPASNSRVFEGQGGGGNRMGGQNPGGGGGQQRGGGSEQHSQSQQGSPGGGGGRSRGGR